MNPHSRTYEFLPLLTPEEEQALAKRVWGDDPNSSREAREVLVRHNQGLAVAIANKLCKRRPSLSWDDAVSNGVLGLIRAAEKYTPDRGMFATYASYWVRCFILEGMSEASFIHIPHRTRIALRKMCADYSGERGARPLGEGSLKAARKALRVKVVSMTGDRDSGRDATLAVASPETGLSIEDRDALQNAIGSLRSSDRRIIIRRFGLGGGTPATLKQMGKEFRVTGEAMRRRIHCILGRLRVHLDDYKGDVA